MTCSVLRIFKEKQLPPFLLLSSFPSVDKSITNQQCLQAVISQSCFPNFRLEFVSGHSKQQNRKKSPYRPPSNHPKRKRPTKQAAKPQEWGLHARWTLGIGKGASPPKERTSGPEMREIMMGKERMGVGPMAFPGRPNEHSVIAGPRARRRTMLFKTIMIAGLMVMTTAGVVPNARAVYRWR